MQFRGAKVVLRDGLDLTDQVKQDIYTAWLALQNLNRMQPGMQYKSMVSSKGWKVSSLNGKEKIEILGYLEEFKEEEKEEVKLKTEYEFIPGICMIVEEDYKRYVYGYGTLNTAYISVCMTPNWHGTLAIIPEYAIVDEPGEKWPDVPGHGIIGLTEYGVQSWDYWFDLGWDDTEDSISDTGFNPVPYLGNSLVNGVDDYGLDILQDATTVLYYGTSYLTGCNEQAAFVDDWKDNYVGGDSDRGFVDAADTGFHDDDETCLDMGADGCCDEILGASHYLGSGRCGGGHLMFDVNIIKHRCRAVYDAYKLMGICFGYESTIEKEFTTSEYYDSTFGSPQDRIYIETVKANTYLITDGIPDRVTGEITSVITEYIDRDHHRLQLFDVCDQLHTQTYYKYNPYLYNRGVSGAYVPDSVADNLTQDKYLIMYIENVYEVPLCIKTADEFALDPGYPKYTDGGATYLPGTPNAVSGSCSSSQYDILFADVNGMKVEIDRSEVGDVNPYFYVSDSHILTAMGNTYYMYAYSYMKYIGGKLGTDRIRYGYFKNTGANHFRSPLFSSAGLQSTSGSYTTSHHDVNGSKDFPTPLYGIGKCAGFLKKRTKEYI